MQGKGKSGQWVRVFVLSEVSAVRGDVVLLALGRDPDPLMTTFMTSEAEAKRQVRFWKETREVEGWEVVLSRPDSCVVEKDERQDTCAYYLFEPQGFQRRLKGFLIGVSLRVGLRPV